LNKLAQKLVKADETQEFSSMDQLTKAEVLQKRLGGKRDVLGQAVAALLHATHFSLLHAILSQINCDEVVTTNYDRLYEKASQAAGLGDISVLPHAPRPDSGRWLLKMHGCVSQPGGIVLTRKDYIRYSDRNQALSGIVQAKLLTSHMLFVGFAMSDDNFHRIADSVKRAVTNREAEFGTSLQLQPHPLMEELWQKDIRFNDMAVSADEPSQLSAVRLEILLDLLAVRLVSGGSPIMDTRFDGVLSDGQKQLRDGIQKLLASCPADSPARSCPEWALVQFVVHKLGGPEERVPSER